jgi:signal transduction histidine kinase
MLRSDFTSCSEAVFVYSCGRSPGQTGEGCRLRSNPLPFGMHPRRGVEVEVDWPPAVGVVSIVIPLAISFEIAHERGLFADPDIRLLWVILAALPFVLDCLDLVVPFRVSLHPVVFSAVVIGACTALLREPAELDFVPFFFVLMSAEMAARLKRWLGLAIAAACAGVMVWLEISNQFEGAFIWIVGIGFGFFAGAAMQSQFLLTKSLREAQADLAESAAADERQRIAREVHDVIAHSLSVSMLHMTAARMALERGQVQDAIDALSEAETQGRSSLSEVRRTVGLLGPDESVATAPLPGVADLPRLSMEYQNAGVRVEMRIDADLNDLPPAASLNIYRIVQESLTNAVKHAPGSDVRVLVQVAEGLKVRVQNNAGNGSQARNETGTGMGLQSMTERAALLGGKLEVTQDAEGYTVTVVAPRPKK